MSGQATAAPARLLRAGRTWVPALSYGMALLLGLGLVLCCFPANFLFPHAGQPWAPVGDMAQHVVGQRYFMRDEWRWPLLVVPDLGFPDGTNIAFTDSIPLEAMVLRLFAPLLPAGFDGIGLWYALCWLLQPVAAVWCLRSAGEHRLLPAVAVAVTAASMPAWWHRFGHDALCGQFLLLLALGFYFRLTARGRWSDWASAGLLNVLTLLIHPYLCIMELAVLAAVPATLLFRRNRRWLPAACGIAVIAAAIVGSATLLGYVGAQGPDGYGLYSMNVLSPVWPAGSVLFPSVHNPIDATGEGGGEGYNYLGAGLLAGLATVLILCPRSLGASVTRHAGLVVVMLGLTLFAISTRVGFGHRVILDLHYVNGLMDQFRATGRFFWPVAYALLIGVALLLARHSRPEIGAGLLVLVAGLQFTDNLYSVRNLRARLSALPGFTVDTSTLRRDFAAARQITVLPSWSCIPPDQAEKAQAQSLELLTLASEHPRPINTVYVARWYHPPRCDEAARAASPLAPGEVRVILPAARQALLPLVPDALQFCRAVGELTVCQGRQPQPLAFGSENFAEGGTGLSLLGSGWSHPENWGIWSEGSRAGLYLYRAGPTQRPLALHFRVVGFAPREGASQRVTVLDGATPLASWTLREGQPTVETLTLPAIASPRLTHLVFAISQPTAPAGRGVNTDGRPLGVGLIALEIAPAGG